MATAPLDGADGVGGLPTPVVDLYATRRQLLVGMVIAAASALPLPVLGEPAEVPVAEPGLEEWRSVLEVMFPHERLENSLYAVPAGALVAASSKDAASRALLLDGWRQLARRVGGNWSTADVAARTRALGDLVGSPFFAVLRQTMVFTFYADPRVWSAFGYDGDAWRFGGYLGRGVNTIDWLPDPPSAATTSGAQDTP